MPARVANSYREQTRTVNKLDSLVRLASLTVPRGWIEYADHHNIRRQPLPQRVREADVGQVASHITCRQIERAIERDGEMREVAANTIAALQDVPRRQIGPTRHVAILDIFVNPATDGLNALHSVFDVADFFPGEIGEFVGAAIPARKRIASNGAGRLPGASGSPAIRP